MVDILLNDIRIDFGFKQILKGVNLEIKQGDKIGIVGGNGAGKTTLFRIITRAQQPDSGEVTIRRGATVGCLEQTSEEVAGGFGPGGAETISETGAGLTVEDVIKEAQRDIFEAENRLRALEMKMSETGGVAMEKLLKEYGRLQNEFVAMDGYEAGERFSKICAAFKFGDEKLRKPFAELSGGQQTTVRLARVLLQAPDILLLDEPTNHIDIQTMEWLEGIVREYRGTVVVVSHDRCFLDKTVSRTVLLEQGLAEVFEGNYSFCLQEQERIMMLEFEQYKNRQKMLEAMKAAYERFKRWGDMNPSNTGMQRRAKNMQKRIERFGEVEKPQPERSKLPLNFVMGNRSGKRALTVKGLTFGYGERVLFNDAGLEVLFKEKVCLLGANGTGKTSLIKLILDGHPCVTAGESVRFGYIPQTVTFPDENATVLSAFRDDAKVTEEEARRVLARFYFVGDEVHKRLGKLSGGERVIIKLAMLVQRDINFLILDEPTNHLDIYAKETLEDSLESYTGTLLFVSHDRYFINKVADRVAEIEGMRINYIR